jgi:hypothetical protein
MKAFVIARDRVTYTKRCTDSLTAALLDVVIVDHGSTWQPMLEWLNQREAEGGLILWRGNAHPRDLWGWQPFRELCAGNRFVVTDPDVVPSETCPDDWVQHLSNLLDKYPSRSKAGLSLRIDRIPEHYYWRAKVLSWEQQFWASPIAPGVYSAGIDTTLAVYQPLAAGGFDISNSLRTGFPYVADHLSWSEDYGNLPSDVAYYYEHAERGISHWAVPGHSNWDNC